MKEVQVKTVQQKRGTSCLVKSLLGCGCLGLLFFVGTIGVGVFGVYWGMQQVDSFSEPFVARGYDWQTAQVIKEGQKVEGPKGYTAQQVVLNDGSDSDLAFAAQVVEIHGRVEGDVDILGQLLRIHKDGSVAGDINCKAVQVVVIEGEVDGEVTGNYQTITDRRPKTEAKPARIPLEESPETLVPLPKAPEAP